MKDGSLFFFEMSRITSSSRPGATVSDSISVKNPVLVAALDQRFYVCCRGCHLSPVAAAPRPARPDRLYLTKLVGNYPHPPNFSQRLGVVPEKMAGGAIFSIASRISRNLSLSGAVGLRCFLCS